MTCGGCRVLDESRCVSGRIESRIGLPGREDCHSTGDPTSGVGSWSQPALAHCLSTGHVEGRGTASGPMGEAVDLSLVHLTSEDIATMVAYLRTVPPIANPNAPGPKPPDAVARHSPGVSGHPRGEADLCGSLVQAATDERARVRFPASRRSRTTLSQRSVRRLRTPRLRPPPTMSRHASTLRVRV